MCPNWCGNVLTITGYVKELKRFRKFAKTENYYKKEEVDKDNILDFYKFVPFPPEIEAKEETAKEYHDLCEKETKGQLTQEEREELALMRIENDTADLTYNFDSNSWCSANWGTKWNSCYAEVQDDIEDDKDNEDEDCLRYSFDTAWGPPCPVVLAMSKMFPNLSFSLFYEETGMDFEGDFNCIRGIIVKDEDRPSSANIEYAKELEAEENKEFIVSLFGEDINKTMEVLR